MVGARRAHNDKQDVGGTDLFRRIGLFLADHRLSPDPEHYRFAWQVLREPTGPLAQIVDQLTDGGIRLSRTDIEQLGGQAVIGTAPVGDGADRPAAHADEAARAIAGLVARTQMQVDDFTRMMRSIEDDTRVFGQDLQASADAMATGTALGIDEVVALTAAMIERVRATEERLHVATEEAADLRAKLEEAQGDARQDPLTGLPNRRALEEAFRGLSAGVPACLAVCDVDRFKQINDRFGHGVGDRVLTAIGQTLTAECAGHLAVRYGGEEFAILFSGLDLGAARELLDGARLAVAGRRFRDRETGAPLGAVTFSAGLGGIAPGETLETAVIRVDRALYRAKGQGRNCVVMAEPPMIGA